MIAKCCFALALAGAPLVVPASDPIYVKYDAVKLVDCGFSRGTAWRVGSGSFVSVDHVTDEAGCTIDNEPVKVTFASKELDFSSTRSRRFGVGLKYSCEGYISGQIYTAVGHAEGKWQQRAIIVQADDTLSKVFQWKGFTPLIGRERFIPGMSGGPVFNQRGEVVGLVNGYNAMFPISFSQALKDTPLCRA